MRVNHVVTRLFELKWVCATFFNQKNDGLKISLYPFSNHVLISGGTPGIRFVCSGSENSISVEVKIPDSECRVIRPYLGPAVSVPVSYYRLIPGGSPGICFVGSGSENSVSIEVKIPDSECRVIRPYLGPAVSVPVSCYRLIPGGIPRYTLCRFQE